MLKATLLILFFSKLFNFFLPRSNVKPTFRSRPKVSTISAQQLQQIDKNLRSEVPKIAVSKPNHQYFATRSEIELFVECATKWVGTPYIWGGDDFEGLDCSGLVQECLESVGKNPPGGDKNSHNIYLAIKKYRKSSAPTKGSVLFFGKKDKIVHTAIAISDKFMVEAGGGNARTTTRAAAIEQNAWVRIRPIGFRRDLVAAFPL